MNKILYLFVFCMFILLVSCSSEKKSENIDYLGKTRAEIIKERGNPVEDEKQLGKFDEVIAYGKDFLNYEVFFLKNDICFQHNQTYPVEMFDKKYEELKKEFGEPVKGTDRFSFKDGLVQLTYVNKEDAEKITENKLVFDGTGAKESFTVLWGCIE